MADFTGKLFADRYQVEAFLGRGGMADVYKVWDRQRAVHLALKILHEDLGESPAFFGHFQQEAKTLAMLQHPNIVRCYGLEEADRLLFLLMDFIDGLTLRKEIYLYPKGMPPTRILEIIRPVCAALHYAHQMGMVHCDIKPANIMIQRNGTVYLADFGIAHMTDTGTHFQNQTGTPAYMAPEQLLGQATTPVVDIYALGVVIYEMLTGGKRPFTGDQADPSGENAADITQRIIWEKNHLAPPLPSSIQPGIAPELEQVVLRCLEHDPQKRYASALDLLHALEQALHVYTPATDRSMRAYDAAIDLQPTTYPPQEIRYRFLDRSFWKRRSVFGVGMVWWAALLFVLASTVFVTSIRAAHASQAATLARATVEASTRFAHLTAMVTRPSASVTPTLPVLPSPTNQPPRAALPLFTQTPSPVPTLMGGSGQIAFVSDRDGSLQIWTLDVSHPESRQQVTHAPGGACQPAWSPDAAQIAFVTPCSGPSEYYPGAAIKTIRLRDKTITDIPLDGAGSFDPVWTPDGKTLVFTTIVINTSQIRSYSFEDQRIRTLVSRGVKSAQPAVSHDGLHIAFVTRAEGGGDELWLMEVNGNSQEMLSRAGNFAEPAWDADDMRILVSVDRGDKLPILTVFDRATQNLTQLAAERYRMSHGSVSPDGAWFAFWTDQGRGVPQIRCISQDGKLVFPLTSDSQHNFQPSWRPRTSDHK